MVVEDVASAASTLGEDGDNQITDADLVDDAVISGWTHQEHESVAEGTGDTDDWACIELEGSQTSQVGSLGKFSFLRQLDACLGGQEVLGKKTLRIAESLVVGIEDDQIDRQ